MLPSRPYDAEIEYLQSTGHSWIDMNVKLKSSDIVTIYASINNRNSLFGCASNAARFNVTGTGNVTYAYFGNISSSYGGTETSYNVPYVFQLGDYGKFYIDGTLVGSREMSFTCTQTALMFARNQGISSISAADLLVGKVFWCKITANDGSLIRDFIPVRIGSTGYMYDKVSKQLFGNKGASNFILGPDKSKPVMSLFKFKSLKPTARDYVQDGLVAMWDGIENAGWGLHDSNATSWVDLVGASEIPLNDEWSFGDNNLYVPSQRYGGSHIPMIIPTGETGQLDLCFSASGYTSSYGWILDGGLGLGNARGPCFDSPLGANADFPAGTSMKLRYWPESTLEIKRPYAYSVSFDGSNRRMITDGVISQSIANTGNFNGVSVFNAYNYSRSVIGRIFNIRLYSRALTAAEIAANYAVDKARFNLP